MHEGHRERLKKRFKTEGLASFSDIQALELLLFYALPRVDTNPLAHRLLEAFGSLPCLFEADAADIAAVEGIGEHSALLIKLLPEMARKFWMAESKGGQSVSTVELAVRFIRPLLFGKPLESVYVFCLDGRFRVRHYDCISEGSAGGVPVLLRRIAECAMRLHSEKILLAHNHPGGSPEPSAADIQTTLAVEAALLPLSIELVDHIIISGHSYFSFSGRHILSGKYPPRPEGRSREK